MAKTGKFLSLHHLLANFLQLLFILEATKSSGLSIKLIHSHSLESPFYPGNITRSERIRLQVQTASAYAHRLSTAISSGTKTNNSNKTIGSNSIRPKMDNQELMYLVQTGIGMFSPPCYPYDKYLLHLDTASDLMWTQCEDCRKMGRGSCFRQAAPLFPASGSRTYRPLPCDRHALCYPGQCINGTCSYSLKYGDGASSLGYLAYESLTFDSDKNKTETVKDVVYGCGIKNKGFSESSKYNLVAGNFGLGPGKRSFLRQKQSLTLGRFSYCLPPWAAAHNFTVFLRFGADIPQREGLKVTPLMTSEGFVSYFVKLKGISVGNTRLDIPQKSFARSNNSYGGCIVDTGSSITLMPEPVYEKLKEMLIKNHFLRYKKTRKQGIMNLCYLFPRNTGLRDLPSLTFHLQDADLVVPPEVGYIYGRTNFGKYYFCLGMSSENVNGMTIIGALQQANKRFIFDTVKRKLYFGPEDCTLGKTNGLKLPLIHPESPESPVFDSNITDEERIQRLIYQSHAQAVEKFSTIVSSVGKSKSSHEKNPELVRPQVGIQSPYYYMVKIGIGTFKTKPLNPSFKSYFLYMDTGSDLLWIQCEGCRAPGGRCFPQKEPVYPNSGSSSYHPLPCNNHSLCVPNQCINSSCSYNIRYLDSTSSSGLLASENFAFSSNVGQMEVLENLVFGCGVDNRKSYGNSSNQIAGIMGLGWGSHSILSQANSLTEGKFSYCLPAINKYTQKWPNTYLRFGRDIVKRQNLSSTTLLRNKDQDAYHVVLQGISINSKKLNISDKDFRIRGDGSCGCIIDSGTPFSRLIKPAYIVLEKALRSYFWGRRNLKPYKGPKGLELCYESKKSQGYKDLPRMTLHFQEANLVVHPEALFLVMDKIAAKGEYFCLAILPSDFVTVIGSYQQTNHRLIYDTKQKQLLFGPEDCSKDA